MRRVAVILLLITLTGLYAGKLISPDEALARAYGKDSVIKQEKLTLTPGEVQDISASANTKVKTSKFRIFSVIRGEKTVAHAVLITQTVRTKSAAVLYMIAPGGTIEAVEIVAFNEPDEFIPPASWIAHFQGKGPADPLRLDGDIPNITGATMSARVITDGSRIALAIFRTLIKKQA